VDEKNQDSGSASKKQKKNEKAAMCDLCGKEFTNSAGLRKHLQNVHLVGHNGVTFQCDICSRVCTSKRLLYKHMRSLHRIEVRALLQSSLFNNNKFFVVERRVRHLWKGF